MSPSSSDRCATPDNMAPFLPERRILMRCLTDMGVERGLSGGGDTAIASTTRITISSVIHRVPAIENRTLASGLRGDTSNDSCLLSGGSSANSTDLLYVHFGLARPLQIGLDELVVGLHVSLTFNDLDCD